MNIIMRKQTYYYHLLLLFILGIVFSGVIVKIRMIKLVPIMQQNNYSEGYTDCVSNYLLIKQLSK